MIRIGLLGSRGRMGSFVSRLVTEKYSATAVIAAQAGRGDSFDELLGTDVIIDFSSPEASASIAQAALNRKEELPVFIVGSTGWKPEQLQTMDRLAARTPVLLSSNFSMGVLAVQKILKTFAPALVRLGYEPSLLETHHQHKKDAPSGTAILLGQTIEKAAQIGPVKTRSVRTGEIVGEHEITFSGPSDRITITHSAQDRSIFARGAIDAALWAHRERKKLALEKSLIPMERFFDSLL